MNAGTGEIRTTVQKSVVCVGDVMHIGKTFVRVYEDVL